MKKWFQGPELLERWGILFFELREICRSGALTPICDKSGFRTTPDGFPCVYCDHVGEGCPHFDRDDCGFANVPGFKTEHAITALLESWFSAAEVLAYEQAHGLKPATTTTEPGHDQQVDGYARPLPGDKPEDYIQRLKDKGVHDDEIQYRVYEYRLPRWGFSQWKAHCRVNDIDYPPKGLKGDPDRDKYGKAYRDARDRHLARAGASEKSEFMPEKSEFMT